MERSVAARMLDRIIVYRPSGPSQMFIDLVRERLEELATQELRKALLWERRLGYFKSEVESWLSGLLLTIHKERPMLAQYPIITVQVSMSFISTQIQELFMPRQQGRIERVHEGSLIRHH